MARLLVLAIALALTWIASAGAQPVAPDELTYLYVPIQQCQGLGGVQQYDKRQGGMCVITAADCISKGGHPVHKMSAMNLGIVAVCRGYPKATP